MTPTARASANAPNKILCFFMVDSALPEKGRFISSISLSKGGASAGNYLCLRRGPLGPKARGQVLDHFRASEFT